MKKEILAIMITLGWGVKNASAAEVIVRSSSTILQDSVSLNEEQDSVSLAEKLDSVSLTQKQDSIAFQLTPTTKGLTSTLPKPEKRNFTDSKLYQMTFVGAPLIALGFIMKGEDAHFRCLRFDYMKEFHRPFDNYTQYLPGVVMLGMKAFGVKGRSDWGRMLVSDIASAAIMGSVVNTLKSTTNVMRPDGSNDHSFPSGHTALAFMTATMLAKEYGHISPWVGVGAYTFATGTGLMRIANNKHWLSDVLTGAGIGILSTEFGYYIADLLFKEKGIHHFDVKDTFSRDDKPSFLGLYLGINLPLSHYDIAENREFRTSSGSSAGIEGAYFFSPYIGVGGRFTASNTHIITSEKSGSNSGKVSATGEGNNHRASSVAEDNTFDAVAMMAGPYFSYPITSRWNVGSKLLAGYVGYQKLKLTDGTIVPKNGGVCFGSGISFGYKAKGQYGIRFFLDYNLIPSHSKHSGEWMNTLAVGSSFGVNF